MRRLPPSNLGAWREIARETIADGRIFTVERSTAESPIDGKSRPFHRIRSVDWAQLLPITRDNEAVLVRQYRHGPQRITLEMPNRHHLPIDLTRFGMETRNEIFVPTEEPHGLIKATLTRPTPSR